MLPPPVLAALNGTTQNNDFPVSATDTNNQATICFTLDGSTPACSSAGVCEGTSEQYDASKQIPINGGVTNPAQLETFCRSPSADALCRPPPPSSEMRRKRLALLASDSDFPQRYSEADKPYRDDRVRVCQAIERHPVGR